MPLKTNRTLIFLMLLLAGNSIFSQALLELNGSFKCEPLMQNNIYQFLPSSDNNGSIVYFTGAINKYVARDEVTLKNGSIVPCEGKSAILKINNRIVPNFNNADFFDGKTISSSYSDVNKSEVSVPNPSKPVTNLKGELGNSPFGGASYSFPLDFPKGTGNNGLNLGIVYDSQNPNGLLGLGCDLKGLSSINRTPQTFYHDNNFAKMDFSPNDRFTLDGNRLLLKSGVYGGMNAEYTLENDNFATIKSFTNGSSNVPINFVVTDNSGSIYTYDILAYSKNSNPSLEAPYSIYLGSYIDVNGNTTLYNYSNFNGNLLINEIIYSNVSIKFDYTPRVEELDIVLKKVAGNLDRTIGFNALLKNVTVKIGGELYKQYKFEYENVNHYSRLNSIQVKDDQGTDWNPIKLLWNQPTKNITKESLSLSSFSGVKKIFSGDFGGDNKTDIVLFTD